MLPVHVLGLAGSFRGSRLLADLRGYGLDPRHVIAIDAAVLTPAGLADIYDSDAARWVDRELTPAEAACAAGHLAMLESFLRTDAEWGLFLEDDAVLLRDPMPLARTLPAASPTPIVVHVQAAVPRGGGARRVRRAAGVSIWTVPFAPDGTSGYLANRALARLATDAYRDHRVDSTADWPVRWRYDATFAVCEPPLVSHAGSDSAIEHDRAIAQGTGVRDKRTRLVRLVATATGLDLAAARQYGYPRSLVLALNVVAPLRRVAGRWAARLPRR